MSISEKKPHVKRAETVNFEITGHDLLLAGVEDAAFDLAANSDGVTVDLHGNGEIMVRVFIGIEDGKPTIEVVDYDQIHLREAAAYHSIVFDPDARSFSHGIPADRDDT